MCSVVAVVAVPVASFVIVVYAPQTVAASIAVAVAVLLAEVADRRARTKDGGQEAREGRWREGWRERGDGTREGRQGSKGQ